MCVGYALNGAGVQPDNASAPAPGDGRMKDKGRVMGQANARESTSAGRERNGTEQGWRSAGVATGATQGQGKRSLHRCAASGTAEHADAASKEAAKRRAGPRECND